MLTLDIDDNRIRMMVVRGKRVETAATLPLEPGLVQDGVVTNRGTVSRRIAQLMADHGITEKKVVVGISGIHSIYRVVNVPKLPKSLLDEAAKREAERVMPVSLSELYTSWQYIPLSDIENALCVVGLPLNTVDAMLDTLREAVLQPEAIDVRPLALARVADERDAIVVNVEPVGFDIVLMIDGVPELLRSLPYPSGVTSTAEKVTEAKEELERTVAFYNSSHKSAPISQYTAAFVTGELGEMLAQSMDYPVKPLPQLLSYDTGLNPSEYAANIGLALKLTRTGISQARVSIDVMPEAYRPKPLPIVPIVSWAFVIIAIALIFMLGTSTLQAVRKTQTLQTQVNTAQTQVQIRQGGAEAIKQMQTEIDEATKTQDTFKKQLDTTKAQREKVNLDLATVTSLLPGIVKLNSINRSEGLTVTGTAPDETTIVNYVRDLRNSGQFSEVLISGMSEMEYNQWRFTLTLK